MTFKRRSTLFEMFGTLSFRGVICPTFTLGHQKTKVVGVVPGSTHSPLSLEHLVLSETSLARSLKSWISQGIDFSPL